jgi:hypothetical protein
VVEVHLRGVLFTPQSLKSKEAGLCGDVDIDIDGELDGADTSTSRADNKDGSKQI